MIADGAQHRPEGKLDVYGAGFDTILASSAPAQHPRIVEALGVLITQEEASMAHTVDVILTPVNGDEVASAHGELGPMCPAAQTRSRGPAPGHRHGIAFNSTGLTTLPFNGDGQNLRNPIRLFVDEAAAHEP